jgi:hypothetical protein
LDWADSVWLQCGRRLVILMNPQTQKQVSREYLWSSQIYSWCRGLVDIEMESELDRIQ